MRGPAARRAAALGGATANYDEFVSEQAKKWLAEALATVPADVVAHAHAAFDESFAEGLIAEVVRLEAELAVVGGSGGGLAGRHSLGSVVNELLYSSPVPVAVAPRGARNSKVDRVREVTCALGERTGRGSAAGHRRAGQRGGGDTAAVGVTGGARSDRRVAAR